MFVLMNSIIITINKYMLQILKNKLSAILYYINTFKQIETYGNLLLFNITILFDSIVVLNKYENNEVIKK